MYQVCAYNRTVEKVDQFLANEAKGLCSVCMDQINVKPHPFHPAGTKVIGAHSMEEMVGKLKKPRRVMMLVKAGSAVDTFIDKLVSTPRGVYYMHHAC